MKKEKSPILVLLCILFLLLFIALPPIFRSFIPKEEKNISNVIKDKLEILICSKTFNEEMYSVTSKTKYLNNYINNNTITYLKLTEAPTNQATTQTSNTTTVADEYGMLSTLTGVNIKTTDTSNIITIDNNLIKNNPNNELLPNYFQDIANQQTFYESKGYNCNILKAN